LYLGFSDGREETVMSTRQRVSERITEQVPTSPFPRRFGAPLFEQGRIGYHPVFPGRPGFGARRIETEADVEDVIALLRLNYERVVARHGLPDQAAA
jgi:Family of unknown function (DUF5519)